MEEVLINLIENAVQHAASPKGILIGAEKEETHIQFYVRDYGPGIPMGDQERLFQTDDPNDAQHGSSGLGLYIVKKVVEAHGGVISVQSPAGEQGAGSQFSFTVPIMEKVKISPPDDSSRIHPQDPKSYPRGRQLRILAVDSQVDFQTLYQTILTEDRYDLEIAQDGKTAIEISQVAPPDLILLDAKLPDMDGISVCRQIRRWADVPIIMVTSRSAQEDVIGALDAGADDYLIKPFAGDELLARIRAVLRRGVSLKTKRRENRFTQKGLVIDYATREVWIKGKKVKLTATEFDLLAYFSKNIRKTLTYDQIIDSIWGRRSGSTRHALSVHISRLRKKIEPDSENPCLIITRWGVGYVFLPGSDQF
jgi:two-component system KDP operon response regulator KdpE